MGNRLCNHPAQPFPSLHIRENRQQGFNKVKSLGREKGGGDVYKRQGLALGPLYLIAFAIGMQLIRQFLSMSA